MIKQQKMKGRWKAGNADTENEELGKGKGKLRGREMGSRKD